MSFRVVSYFTRATIYETIMVNYLMPSLNLLNIPNAIYGLNDTKSWETNACFQPSIIWTAMKTWPNDKIVWMDSDVIIRHYPTLFEEIPGRCDIGLYYMKYEDNWQNIPAQMGIDTPRPELNTGVIWFNNTPKMLAFVEEWMDRCAAEGGTGHRKHLHQLVNDRLSDDLSFFLIPRAYAYVAQREDGKVPAVPMKDPFVMQFTASAFGKKDLYNVKPFLGEA